MNPYNSYIEKPSANDQTTVNEPVNFNPQSLPIIEAFREGPRYWVGKVFYNNEPVILKRVINEDIGIEVGYSPSAALNREIFLIPELNKFSVDGFLPQVLVSNSETPSWVIATIVPGKHYAVPGSSFLFQPEFFKPQRIDQTIRLISSYQQIPLNSPNINSRPMPPLEKFISFITEKASVMPDEIAGLFTAGVAILNDRMEDYNNTSQVFAHSQVYPDHLFFTEDKAGLVDWESSEAQNRLFDYVSVYVHAITDEDWQNKFKQTLYENGTISTPKDDELWQTNLVIQLMGNIQYLYDPQFDTLREREIAGNKLVTMLRETLAA